MIFRNPIPLVKENLPIGSSSEEVRVYRDTFDDCVDYICQLCEEAIPDLPLSITDVINEMGRITRPIAATLLAEARVTGASPLFNGNPDFQDLTDNRGMKLFSEEDPNKWNVAAVACKEAVEICKEAGISQLYEFNDSRYDLSEETRRGMSIRGASTEKWNEELIWGNPVNTSAQLQQRILPCFKDKDWSHTSGPIPEVYPTFRMAELFYSQNGVPIEEDVNYDHPHRYQVVTVGDDHTYYIKKGERTAYLNLYREPRFYASVAYNGSVWHMLNASAEDKEETNVPIFYYRDAQDGYKAGTNYLSTGIGIKKFVHPKDLADSEKSYDVSRVVQKYAPDIRYAEILLNYAEALNEVEGSYEIPSWNGETMYTITRSATALKEGIQPIRIRAGLPDYEVYDDVKKFRFKVKRERQIELFAEGHRFFDIRRWCDAPVEEALPIYGCNIYLTSENPDSFHTPIEVASLPTMFTTKMWFWPIHHNIMKRNMWMIQNPGWKDPE